MTKKYITDVPIFKKALECLKDKDIRDKVNIRLNYLLNYSCGWDMGNWDGLYFTTYEYCILDDLPILDQLIFLMVILGNDENGKPLLPLFEYYYEAWDTNDVYSLESHYGNKILYDKLALDMFNGVDFYQILENLEWVDLPAWKTCKFKQK